MIWNKQEALNKLMNNEELLNQIIQMLHAEMPDNIAKLEQAVNDLNLEEIRFNAHTIKGVAANICAGSLQQASFDLEVAAKAEETGDFPQLIGNVKQAYEDLKQQTLA